jgi:hypothetical protein
VKVAEESRSAIVSVLSGSYAHRAGSSCTRRSSTGRPNLDDGSVRPELPPVARVLICRCGIARDQSASNFCRTLSTDSASYRRLGHLASGAYRVGMDGGWRATPVLVDPDGRDGPVMWVFRVLIYTFLVVPLVLSLTGLAVVSAVVLVTDALHPESMRGGSFWVYTLLQALYLGGYLWWTIRWVRSRLATPVVLDTTIDLITYHAPARGMGSRRRWAALAGPAPRRPEYASMAADATG